MQYDLTMKKQRPPLIVVLASLLILNKLGTCIKEPGLNLEKVEFELLDTCKKELEDPVILIHKQRPLLIVKLGTCIMEPGLNLERVDYELLDTCKKELEDPVILIHVKKISTIHVVAKLLDLCRKVTLSTTQWIVLKSLLSPISDVSKTHPENATTEENEKDKEQTEETGETTSLLETKNL